MGITVQEVETLRHVLAELPRHEGRQVSKQEAVALLAVEIRAAQRRGYPPEEIVRILSERGIPINVATLRGYLRRTKKKSRRPDHPAPSARKAAPGTGQLEREAVGTAPTDAASSRTPGPSPESGTDRGGVGAHANVETPRAAAAPSSRR